MKGAIGLGLIIGIIAAMFLPYVFALINYPTAFAILNGAFSGLGSGIFSQLPYVFTGAFEVMPVAPASLYFYNPDILGIFSTGGSFMQVLPAILVWVVAGFLSGLFAQSAKKGVLSSVVFIIVEILLFLLMTVISGTQSLMEVLTNLNGLGPMAFVGSAIIVPLFGIVGGVIGGVVSQGAFGPEEY
jgi:hypothetical protein